jgi:pectin methylesterase-like acyl-CoA thioesterase
MRGGIFIILYRNKKVNVMKKVNTLFYTVTHTKKRENTDGDARRLFRVTCDRT